MAGRSRGPRAWLVIALVAALAVVAWGGWSWWSDDDQVRERFASSIGELAGVDETEDSDGSDTVLVRMERDATVRQVLAVTRRADRTDCCRLHLHLGPARLVVDHPSSLASNQAPAELLTVLGQVDFAGDFRVPTVGSRTLSMDAREPDDTRESFRAAADALRSIDKASHEAQIAVDGLIASIGSDSAGLLVNDTWDQDVRRRAARLLDLAAGTETIDGVEAGREADSTSVSTTVTDIGEVETSWQSLARTVRPVQGTVIRMRVGDADDALRIVGSASDSPAPALEVMEVMRRAGGTPSSVRTDLTYVGADVKNPTAAGRLARAVQPLVPAGARLDAAWGPATDQAAGNKIGDRVDVVADLAPRLAVLASQGYAVGWELNGKYRRLVARPLKVSPAPLRKDPSALRREVARIRAVAWPAEARIELFMGLSDAGGSCESSARVVSLQSTAAGPGRDFDGYGCTDDADVQAARRAWNAAR